ncbi:phosphoribosylglycinamide formyltransferase [Thalassoglobus sp.]|uniref:phosphoribosylglycinamide formyltransferase n=1 Tax=Thalassoglobus sp. TaxID=2795869 RepID=UPI003AA8C042
MPLKLAVLISGGGSTMINLQRNIQAGSLNASIPLVIASRPCTGIEKAESAGLTAVTLSPKSFASTDEYSQKLFSVVRDVDADLVILAGFLSKIIIPDDFANRVMNIHPSLLPAFCGKGMYGHRVHEAVITRGCKISGCTVHFCDNEYDHGPIILQQTVPVDATDNADSLAERVQAAECEAYPAAIQLYAENRLLVKEGRVHIVNES